MVRPHPPTLFELFFDSILDYYFCQRVPQNEPIRSYCITAIPGSPESRFGLEMQRRDSPIISLD